MRRKSLILLAGCLCAALFSACQGAPAKETTPVQETTAAPETAAVQETMPAWETTAAPETAAVQETPAVQETTAVPKTEEAPETGAQETTESEEETEMNPTGGRYSWDREAWPEDGHLPSLEEVRAKEEKHGPLTEAEWRSSRSGMMRGDYSTSSLRLYREKGEGRLVCAKMPAFEAETISTYSVEDEVFEKLQALADRENLAAWSFLKPDPEKQIFVTDVSSSTSLRLTFDDSSLGAEFPVTRSIDREAVTMAGGEDVWDEVYDLLSGCVIPENLIGTDTKANPYSPLTGKYEPGPVETAPAAEGTWTCPECGNAGNTTKFCPECGRRKPE